MTVRRLPVVFDRMGFVADVRSYMGRQRLSLDVVAAELAISSESLLSLLSAKSGAVFPVEVAVRLADFSDLSLDKYRRPAPGASRKAN